MSTEKMGGSSTSSTTSGSPKLNPGDDAPPGTPGTGENLCPVCGGSGQTENKPCTNCGGTGKVIEGLGGA